MGKFVVLFTVFFPFFGTFNSDVRHLSTDPCRGQSIDSIQCCDEKLYINQ